MQEIYKTALLRLSEEGKVQVLRDTLKDHGVMQFLGLSRVFLDAPLNEGGLSSSIIEAIHDEYLRCNDPDYSADPDAPQYY